MVDLYPDDLEYVWNFALGGYGRFMLNNWSMLRDTMDGVDTPVERIPFVRRFVVPGESMQVERSEFYRAREEASEKREALRDARKAIARGKNIDEARAAIGEFRPYEAIDARFDAANKQLKVLREKEKTIRSDRSLSRAERQSKLDENKKAQMSIMRKTRMKYEEMRPDEP